MGRQSAGLRQPFSVRVMTLTWLFDASSWSACGSPAARSKSSSYTITSTSGTSPSSRSSMGVNFTWVGPRRPNTCTSVTGDASRPATTFAGTSVDSRSFGCFASTRATSSATLPLPMTAIYSASSGQSRGTSGWPSYQATKSAAP